MLALAVSEAFVRVSYWSELVEGQTDGQAKTEMLSPCYQVGFNKAIRQNCVNFTV